MKAESKDLVIVDPSSSALAIPEDLQGFTGLEGISNETWVIPRMKLVQPTTRDSEEAGKFLLNLTNDVFYPLNMIIVKAVQGRILWSGDLSVDEPDCRSYDFMKPDESIEDPPSTICARMVTTVSKRQTLKVVCEKAMWTGLGKTQKPPECSETFNLLCVTTEDMLPFWLTLHGKNIQPVRGYLSGIALRKTPTWLYHTQVTTKLETNEKGKFYTCSFAPPKPITKDLEESLIPVIQSLRHADVKRIDDEEIEESDGAAPPDVSEWLKDS